MHLTHAELFKIKVTHRVKVRSKAKMQHFGLSSQIVRKDLKLTQSAGIRRVLCEYEGHTLKGQVR